MHSLSECKVITNVSVIVLLKPPIIKAVCLYIYTCARVTHVFMSSENQWSGTNDIHAHGRINLHITCYYNYMYVLSTALVSCNTHESTTRTDTCIRIYVAYKYSMNARVLKW